MGPQVGFPVPGRPGTGGLDGEGREDCIAPVAMCPTHPAQPLCLQPLRCTSPLSPCTSAPETVEICLERARLEPFSPTCACSPTATPSTALLISETVKGPKFPKLLSLGKSARAVKPASFLCQRIDGVFTQDPDAGPTAHLLSLLEAKAKETGSLKAFILSWNKLLEFCCFAHKFSLDTKFPRGGL